MHQIKPSVNPSPPDLLAGFGERKGISGTAGIPVRLGRVGMKRERRGRDILDKEGKGQGVIYTSFVLIRISQSLFLYFVLSVL